MVLMVFDFPVYQLNRQAKGYSLVHASTEVDALLNFSRDHRLILRTNSSVCNLRIDTYPLPSLVLLM